MDALQNTKTVPLPFNTLFNFLQYKLLHITVIVLVMQFTVYIIDLIIFAGSTKLPFIPLMEIFGPWLLMPLVRLLLRKPTARAVLASPYLRLIGGYALILITITLGFVLAFQILNWIYHGEMHGGIFYFASLTLALCWGIRGRARPRLARGGDSTEASA